jgi:hypothetical protein
MLIAVALHGVHGQPYLDLTALLDLSELGVVHAEICHGLAQVPAKYTGGSHRSMQIVPTSRACDVPCDFGEVIAAMTTAEYAAFRQLADNPADFPQAQLGATFGEERTNPLSQAQLRLLEVQYGVYFPWKTFIELMPAARWEEKTQTTGRFTWEAETFFPVTLRFLRALPLTHIGRASILGLASFDHGTVHRDGDDDSAATPSEFIMVCLAANKQLVLWDDAEAIETTVCSRAYWFNDADYHGVRSAPHFRYSLRVDGPFTELFRRQLSDYAHDTAQKNRT